MSEAALRDDHKTGLFHKDFAANGADLPGVGLDWLDARRGEAMKAFAKTGIPTRRVEAWKYTDLAAVLQSDLEPATPFRGHVAKSAALADPFAGVSGPRLVLFNGFLYRGPDKAPKEPEELEIIDLGCLGRETPDWVKENLGKSASGADQTLGAASLALMRGGVAVRVSGTSPAPLHLTFVNPARGTGLMSQSRVLIVLEEDASLDLIETHVGEGEEQLLVNLGIEIVLKKNARLNHVRLQAEAGAVLHVASIGARLAVNARYRALFVALGARLSRADVNIKLAEPGAEASLRCVSVIGDTAHADVTTVMDHAAPHTLSRQLFKSVVGGGARSVSQGRVTIREGAVKSDSHQLFKAVLLGLRAEADAKPELEIFADDVVCGHGTAIGALDADAMFYLRARGLPEAEARSLLVRAFLMDVIEDFIDPAVNDVLWQYIDKALSAIGDTA